MDAVLAKYRQHPASMCVTETHNGQDIVSISIFLDWLESYLTKQKIKDVKVWKSLKSFRRKVYYRNKI